MSYRPLDTRSVRPPAEDAEDHRTVDWWGLIFLIVVILAFFSSVMFSFFFLRFNAEQWPPASIERPTLLLPTIATLTLLASCLPLIWMQRVLGKGERPRFNVGLGLNTGLSVAFLAILIVSLSMLDFGATTNAYGSAFIVTVGFLVVLAIAGLYVGAIVQARAWKGHFNGPRHVAVTSLSTYWYVLTAMWMVVYVSLYLLPYIE
ncbi:MAG: cytochrome c oxidase subunit 3 [Chloroflexia bacterium]|jgi:heme/copper-type cytochrome/quinol oxidase subunit 3|nr:cytochrome c oxidase subunit 3 [Chloroflexia bacterium]